MQSDGSRFSGKKLIEPLRRKTLQIAYLVALAILIVAAVLSYVGISGGLKSAEWVAHTHEVIESLDNFYSLELEAESNERAYVITGQPEFHETCLRRISDADRSLEYVKKLTSDNDRQQRRIELLRLLLDKRNDQLLQIGQLRKLQGFGAAIEKASRGVGGGLMEEVRSTVLSMDVEERDLLNQRTARTTHNAQLAAVAYGVSVVGGLVMLTGIYLLSIRLIRFMGDARVADLQNAERLELEVQRTERARKELERSNRDLEDFAFVASHDLQEPLRKIRSFGERLRRRFPEGLDPGAEQDLSRMQNAAERMQNLINDVLLLSRVTTKTQPFARVDLNRIVDEVLEDLETRINDTKAIVRRGNLPPIEADPVQMRQLIQNLIGNALKFRRAGVRPEVTISDLSVESSTQVRLEFKDNGIGFEDKYSDKIFTVFQRLHGREKYEGTGIGLSICRKIAERHGGTITAQGIPGEGAKFTVMLLRKHEATKEIH